MFWSKNKNSDKQKKPPQKGLPCDSGVHSNSDKSQRLRKEALANVRTARHEIGEEALDRIAAAMTKKQHSVVERAKADIAKTDSDRVKDEIMMMFGDR
jgi:gamma-glutamyl phosphate reductase